MIGIKNECMTPEQQKRKHPTVGKESNNSRIRQDLCIDPVDCFKKMQKSSINSELILLFCVN